MTMTSPRGHALLIIPYFGRFGRWFPLYLHSLAQQSTLDLLLLTDAEPPALPANVRRIRTTLEEVRQRAEQRLGFELNLSTARKLCDLKPAYGLIFDQYLDGYDYWGFGDEDVFYGDLDRLLKPRLLAGPDLVVCDSKMTVGHLTLLRNEARLRELVLHDPIYREVLACETLWAYDENSWAKPKGGSSFTKVVKEAEAGGELRVDWGMMKRGDVPWPKRSYRYDGQRLIDNDGTELAYYHWGRFRGLDYTFPSPDQAQAGFAFDRYGFYAPDLGPMRHALRRALGYGSVATRKISRRLSRHRPTKTFGASGL